MSDSWTVLSNFSLPERSMLRRSKSQKQLLRQEREADTELYLSL